MCGRVVQAMTWQEIVETLQYPPSQPQLDLGPVELWPRYNVYPHGSIAVLSSAGDTLVAGTAPWGWRPHWATDGRLPSNARSEKVAHSNYWRAIWPHRRLIPINGWFEWTPSGKERLPWYIRRRDGRPTLCAAVGQIHQPELQKGDGVVFITADSLGGMVDVHDRRPIALTPERAREWLDPATPKERAEQMLLEGEPPEVFEWFRVSQEVNKPANEGAQLLEPLQEDLL